MVNETLNACIDPASFKNIARFSSLLQLEYTGCLKNVNAMARCLPSTIQYLTLRLEYQDLWVERLRALHAPSLYIFTLVTPRSKGTLYITIIIDIVVFSGFTTPPRYLQMVILKVYDDEIRWILSFLEHCPMSTMHLSPWDNKGYSGADEEWRVEEDQRKMDSDDVQNGNFGVEMVETKVLERLNLEGDYPGELPPSVKELRVKDVWGPHFLSCLPPHIKCLHYEDSDDIPLQILPSFEHIDVVMNCDNLPKYWQKHRGTRIFTPEEYHHKAPLQKDKPALQLSSHMTLEDSQTVYSLIIYLTWCS